MSAEKKHSLPNKIAHLTDMKHLPVRIGQDPEVIKQGKKVIIDNEEEKLLITKSPDEDPYDDTLIQNIAYYPAPMAAGIALGQLWRYQHGTITIHDSRTGLPDYEVEYGGVLRRKVKAVTMWNYPVIKDEVEGNKEATIYGIKKTKIRLSRSTYHQTTTVSEIPRKGGIPDDAVTVKDHKSSYNDSFGQVDPVDRVADDVIAQIRRLPDFNDIKDPRKHRKL